MGIDREKLQLFASLDTYLNCVYRISLSVEKKSIKHNNCNWVNIRHTFSVFRFRVVKLLTVLLTDNWYLFGPVLTRNKSADGWIRNVVVVDICGRVVVWSNWEFVICDLRNTRSHQHQLRTSCRHLIVSWWLVEITRTEDLAKFQFRHLQIPVSLLSSKKLFSRFQISEPFWRNYRHEWRCASVKAFPLPIKGLWATRKKPQAISTDLNCICKEALSFLNNLTTTSVAGTFRHQRHVLRERENENGD